MTVYCTHCGAAVNESSRFCQDCGRALVPAAAPAIAQPAPIPPVTPSLTPAGALPAERYGGFWIRFFAVLVDGLVILVVVMPIYLVLYMGVAGAGYAVGMPWMGRHLVMRIAGQGLWFFVGWFYEALMWSSAREATLGKMLFHLRVTDPAGNRISFARATGRHFAKYLSAMVLFIGYIMAAFTDRHQALHDMLAGTVVRQD